MKTIPANIINNFNIRHPDVTIPDSISDDLYRLVFRKIISASRNSSADVEEIKSILEIN